MGLRYQTAWLQEHTNFGTRLLGPDRCSSTGDKKKPERPNLLQQRINVVIIRYIPKRIRRNLGLRKDLTTRMGHILSEPVTEIHSESYRTQRFTVGAAACQGWRTTMEDAHTIVSNLPNHPETSYFAVFDGHGGSKTATACSQRLHKYITDREEFRSGNFTKAIQMGCLDMDEALKLDINIDDDSGSTAILVMIQGDDIYCGNVGDSRSISMVNGRVVELSHDHKPTNNLEQSRIYNAGGWVESGRVNGLLSLSRAFGDFNMKQNPNRNAKEQIVTAFPDIVKKKITDEWEFIVLACDGIWDVMSNTQLGALVRTLLRRGKTPEDVCRETIAKCRSPACGPLTLGCDNMTMILVAFNQHLTRSSGSSVVITPQASGVGSRKGSSALANNGAAAAVAPTPDDRANGKTSKALSNKHLTQVSSHVSVTSNHHQYGSNHNLASSNQNLDSSSSLPANLNT